MSKKGRPAKADPRSYGYRIRMNEKEMEQFDDLQKMCGKPKADIIREALSAYYRKTKRKQSKGDFISS